MIACTKEKSGREGGNAESTWFSDQEQMDRGICERVTGIFCFVNEKQKTRKRKCEER